LLKKLAWQAKNHQGCNPETVPITTAAGRANLDKMQGILTLQ
jgi:hypothetical protein